MSKHDEFRLEMIDGHEKPDANLSAPPNHKILCGTTFRMKYRSPSSTCRPL